MKEIIAMHGWAGDSNQWSNWKKVFKRCNWEWQSAERGYRKIIPHSPNWNQNPNPLSHKRVAICHSFGLYLIDQEVLYSATHVVLINSFSRFIPSGRGKRSVQIALDRMMNAIDTPSESAMLRKFHAKAHKPNHVDVESTKSNLISISDTGRLRLKNDLRLLMNTYCLPIGLNIYAKVLIINSDQDYILANQTKLNFTEDVKKHLAFEPNTINFREEGHSITKTKNIKKIKHWLEFDHAKNMV